MVVAVSYRLFDASGAKVDEVAEQQPLRYLDGYAQVIPGLAHGMRGARVGESRSFVVAADEAFGERDDSAVLEIDPHDFPDAARVAVGDELLAVGPDGEEAAYRVVEVGADAIVADLNHPLAGQAVRFEATVLSIRPANDEELDAAYREIDERIVYDAAIVYGSGPDIDAENSSSVPHEQATGLVQLRRGAQATSPTSQDQTRKPPQAHKDQAHIDQAHIDQPPASNSTSVHPEHSNPSSVKPEQVSNPSSLKPEQ